MVRAWHISDTHLSFNADFVPIKDMSQRRWAIGSNTYIGYLQAIEASAHDNINDEDFTFITGDIVHDMHGDVVVNSLTWLRKTIRGTIVICRGNHDYKWSVGNMRQKVAHLQNLYLIDEGEVLTIGPYTVGCFSNHSVKTHDFSHVDGRYLEMAIKIVSMANARETTPVMMSHYPVNPEMGAAMGRAGLKAYLSGHIHITDGPNSPTGDGLQWKWYLASAEPTDNKTIEGCFFSTGTTDVVRVTQPHSFKEIECIAVDNKPESPLPEEMIILCGIPGSGKSTLAREYESKYEFIRVNQDELGSKRECIKKAESALKNGKSVIIDRCNFDISQRKLWIDIAKKYNVKKIRAIELVLDKEVCIKRATDRKDHPTIKREEHALAAVNRMSAVYTSPSLGEGLHDIKVIDASTDVISMLNQTFEVTK